MKILELNKSEKKKEQRKTIYIFKNIRSQICIHLKNRCIYARPACVYIHNRKTVHKIEREQGRIYKMLWEGKKEKKKMKENFVEMEKVELVLITYVA